MVQGRWRPPQSTGEPPTRVQRTPIGTACRQGALVPPETSRCSARIASRLDRRSSRWFVVALRRRCLCSYPVSVRLAWPLTGRAQEMRLIEAALSDPGSSGMVICGASGVGKSRIAYEALSAAASRGCETHWAAGSSAARTLPLGAFNAWAQSGGTDIVQQWRCRHWQARRERPQRLSPMPGQVAFSWCSVRCP